MSLIELSDRDVIEAFLRRDAALHLYEVGDLDDFFFPHTRWFGLTRKDGELEAIALLYTATDLPVVVALDREVTLTNAMLDAMFREDKLPKRFYAHFTVDAAVPRRSEPHGLHDRMILGDRSAIEAIDTKRAILLMGRDEAELRTFFADAYPGNWFDPRMLETRTYFGVRDEDGVLSAVSGVHVVSDRTRVGALGNVATLPRRRGRGFARIAVAATCKALFSRADLIGLNVHAENEGAIGLYRTLGFERAAQYEEHLVTA